MLVRSDQKNLVIIDFRNTSRTLFNLKKMCFLIMKQIYASFAFHRAIKTFGFTTKRSFVSIPMIIILLIPCLRLPLLTGSRCKNCFVKLRTKQHYYFLILLYLSKLAKNMEIA